MNVSFEGLENAVVTFQEEQVTAGYPVSMSSDATVGNAAAGTAPVGVALNVRGGCAAVQIRGFAALPYSGSAPDLGWTALTADGSGGVTVAEGEQRYLAVDVDGAARTVTFVL